jgi:hypothetical protein
VDPGDDGIRRGGSLVESTSSSSGSSVFRSRESPRIQHAAQRPLAAGASVVTCKAPQTVHVLLGELSSHLHDGQMASPLEWGRLRISSQIVQT